MRWSYRDVQELPLDVRDVAMAWLQEQAEPGEGPSVDLDELDALSLGGS